MSEPSKDLEPSDFPEQLDWSDGKRDESMRELYSFSERSAKDAIGWYWNNADKAGSKGRAIRFCAIVLTTIGGLIPLLLAAGVRPEWLNGQWGYVFLALAAALVALDKFFGFSSGWIRFVTAATKLQTGLTRFYLDWAELNARRGGNPIQTTDIEPLLQRLQTLLTFVRETIENETQAWATEYQSSLSDLEKRIKSEMEQQTPGVLDISITNGDQSPEGVVVAVDGVVVQTIFGRQGSIRPVFPGQHQIKLTGNVAGNPVADSKLVKVEAGQALAVSATLK